ncbi:MAG: hypothetical protein SF187_22940 [Deltaproteobacteria bacterium]|nr:hypothetical protein [Deltaproteobacteria bacterium]
MSTSPGTTRHSVTRSHDRLQAALTSKQASAKPGSCKAECETLGGSLFVETGGVNGGLRADFYQVDSKHYHLRVGDQLVDPTVYQFFNVPAGFQGSVLAGPKDRFVSALRELHAKFGYARIVDTKVQNVDQFFEEYWGKATLYKSGNELYEHVGKATGRVRGYYK